MAIVEPGQVPQADQDASSVESVKIERNSKGYNWSLRIVLKPGETWTEAFDRLVERNNDLRREFGG